LSKYFVDALVFETKLKKPFFNTEMEFILPFTKIGEF
jgi:hypothetical protein